MGQKVNGRFCRQCGSLLLADARFCIKCGAEVAGAEKPNEADPTADQSIPLSEQIPADNDRAGRRAIFQAIAAVAVILLLAAAGITFVVSRSGKDTASDALNAGNDVSLAPYQDEFLSRADETLYVLGTANMRDRPTAQGTTVLRRVNVGEQIVGRWVRGLDPTTRWLRVDIGGANAGYLWEGNLSSSLAAPTSAEVISDGCQGEGCFTEGTWVASEPIRLFSDHYRWNDNDIDRGFLVPVGARLTVEESIVHTTSPGSATLTCTGTYDSWTNGSDRWSVQTPRRLSAGTRVQTLYYSGEGYDVARRGENDRIAIPSRCLSSTRAYTAEDWVVVRTTAGRSGWTNRRDLLSCSSRHTDCSG